MESSPKIMERWEMDLSPGTRRRPFRAVPALLATGDAGLFPCDILVPFACSCGRLLPRAFGGVIPEVSKATLKVAISHLTRLSGTTNRSALQPFCLEGFTVAKPELGLKRQCMSCGAKFYDLNKDPAVCPKCGTVFQAVALSRVAAPAVARAVKEEDEAEVESTGPELVSLDEVEAAETEKAIPGEDDIDVVDDDSDDDTFLEEEEEGDDDVSDLIDSDIEDDEEA
jgi:uncharacterized protein (TIGR02300 family)